MAKNRFKLGDEAITHLELHEIMGKQIRETLRTDLTPEQREIVNAQSKFLLGFANNMINNSNFILQAEKVLAETNNLDTSLIKDLVY